MKIPVGILCCWHWHIPYVWTSFCSTWGGRRRPSTQSPPQWLSTESKSECEKCVPSLKGPLTSRVYQNYHMTENVFFRQYDRILGKIWHLYLFTQAMLLWCYFWNYRFCAKPDIALLLCVCQKHIISTFFFFNFFGYIGYKDTRSSIQKLMNFRYQKTKPNGQ